MDNVRKIPILLTACLMALGASAQEGKSPEEQAAPEQATLPEGIVRPEGTVITPDSDRAPAGFMHTNYKIFVPKGTESPFAEPQNTFAEYPASIGCVYKVGPIYPGCVPTNNGDHPTGGWGAIALVDAYDDPHAAADLAFFDTYFGVPAANFITVYANSSYGTLNGLTASCNGTPQNANAFGWDLEESLDIEWAHTMAPSAEVILVEACSNSDNDLFYAEQVAGIVVASYGGGDISNSWGGGESSAQLATYDNYFYRYHPYHITYFASAGDTGSEVIYPSSSPWVVSAGGTTINRNANGHFLSESCWSGSGGGFSTVEDWTGSGDQGLGPWADYQYVLFGGTPFANPYRSTPDMSFDSDPNSGVWVRDTDPTNGGGWYVVGGTSVASPALAGIVNSAGNKLGQAGPGGGGGWYTPGENNLIYSQLGSAKNYPDNFYDVKTGSNGHSAGAGYDQCTGVGSPRGKAGK